MNSYPLVSVILINYNGRSFLPDCLNSLKGVTYPVDRMEIIMLDNNSVDSSVCYIKKNFPHVVIVKSNENLGFAQGCNIAASHAKGKYLMLLNTDTRVDKNWLSPLVKRMEKDEEIAAVNSKLLIYYPFLEFSLDSSVSLLENFNKHTKFVSVGVQLLNLTTNMSSLSKLIEYRSGFYDQQEKEKGVWTSGRGQVFLPVDPDKDNFSLNIMVRANNTKKTNLTMRLGGKTLIKDTLNAFEVKKYTFTLKMNTLQKSFINKVQNAGLVVFKNGFGRDRGVYIRDFTQYYEEDGNYYNEPSKVHAFSGASVLIRKDIFYDIGGFDGSFFMYYEDVDFSLKLCRLGYKVFYEPKSIAYHIHSGTSKEWSRLFIYHTEKNRLAVLIKHYPWIVVIGGLIKYLIRLVVSYLKMIMKRLVRDWILYYEFREKVECRYDVLKWVTLHFKNLLYERIAFTKKQKIDIHTIFKELY